MTIDWVIGYQLKLCQLAVSQYRHQDIVKVMSNASSKRPDGFHFLRLPEPLFSLLHHDFRLLTHGNVCEADHRTHNTAIFLNRGTDVLHRKGFSVLTPEHGVIGVVRHASSKHPRGWDILRVGTENRQVWYGASFHASADPAAL